MNRIKQTPLFWSMLLLFGVGLAAEVWLVNREYRRAGFAVTELERIRNEGERIDRQSLFPRDEGKNALEDDLCEAEAILRDLKTRRLRGIGRPGAIDAPESSIDAYLDIAAFVEKSRGMADRAGVAFKSDERFGFATYAREGPEPEFLAAVFRQRVVLEYLVGKLIASRPRAVLLVQREQPRALGPDISHRSMGPAGKTGGQNRQPGQSADIFEIEKGRSLRMGGLLDTEAFRVEFAGQTKAIRSFLNALVSDDAPIIVRSVEIGRWSPAEVGRAGAPLPPARAPTPESLARFVVVVEYVEPFATPAKPIL